MIKKKHLMNIYQGQRASVFSKIFFCLFDLTRIISSVPYFAISIEFNSYKIFHNKIFVKYLRAHPVIKNV
jgi:hypothetical protein